MRARTHTHSHAAQLRQGSLRRAPVEVGWEIRRQLLKAVLAAALLPGNPPKPMTRHDKTWSRFSLTINQPFAMKASNGINRMVRVFVVRPYQGMDCTTYAPSSTSRGWLHSFLSAVMDDKTP
jgi:hypothetical protein